MISFSDLTMLIGQYEGLLTVETCWSNPQKATLLHEKFEKLASVQFMQTLIHVFMPSLM